MTDLIIKRTRKRVKLMSKTIKKDLIGDERYNINIQNICEIKLIFNVFLIN